jgi:hypothetical protein
MKNIFDPGVTKELIDRINELEPTSTPIWGKMNVAQMLAHCNVSYELVYDNIHPKPNPIIKFFLKAFIKNMVVSEKPYKHNGQTSPAFLIKDEKDFDMEKKRLISYINKTQELGEAYFENKESHSFGKLSIQEWNNMFYKHLDHHLRQFGV